MAISSYFSQQVTSAVSDLHHQSSGNTFSRMSDSNLALAFGENFQAFKHPTTPNATTDKIREVAGRALTGDAQRDKQTLLAQEVLKRDNVMDALDSVDANGVRDGVIGPWNPKMAADQLASKPCKPKPCCHKPADDRQDSDMQLRYTVVQISRVSVAY